MPKMQIVTNAMLERAGIVGQGASRILNSQNAVTSIFQNMGKDFSGRVPGLMTQHMTAMQKDYNLMNNILNGYRAFMEDAARNYEWTEDELTRWAESLGNGAQNTSSSTGNSGGTAGQNTSDASSANSGASSSTSPSANSGASSNANYSTNSDTSSGANSNTSTGTNAEASSGAAASQTYENPKQFICDFLREKIGNDYGVAALMGNLHAESGLNANNLQNSYERSIGLNDDEYTAAIDNGSYNNFVNDQAGYGLAQWTYYSRKQGLLDFAREKGTSIGDLQTQLEYLWKELSEGYRGVLNALKNATSIREASDVVLKQFERPADQSESACARRAGYAENIYLELMA